MDRDRDPFATLTLAQAKELAAYAKQRNIEVAYAMNIGLLDPNFWEVFSRGLANAAVFDGPRTIRTAGPGLEFANNEKKTSWSFAELRQAVATANQAANLAKTVGLQYVVENGLEPIKGDGDQHLRHGGALRKRQQQRWVPARHRQLLLCVPGAMKPADAQAFIEKYAGRMGTCTEDLVAGPQGPAGDRRQRAEFDIIFAIATKAKMPYVGFELDQPATLDQAIENHKKSIEYLMGKFGGESFRGTGLAAPASE